MSPGFGLQVVERLAEEARRADGAVVDALADLRLHDLDDGADERARRVVLAAVAPGVAHVLDLGFVEVRQLVLLGLRAEAQLVDVVDDLAQVVAALDLVLDLAEDLADLVFDGVRPAGLLLEAVQVGKELLIDEIAEVVAGQGLVVVELAVLALRRGPALPAVGLVEDVGVLLALQRGLGRLVLLQPVEVLQEQQPRRLLGVVELGRAAGLFPENVVDVLEGLFKHSAGGCDCQGTILNTNTLLFAVGVVTRHSQWRVPHGRSYQMDRRMMDESRCTMPLISRHSFLEGGVRRNREEALLHHKLHGSPVKPALRSKDTRNSSPCLSTRGQEVAGGELSGRVSEDGSASGIEEKENARY